MNSKDLIQSLNCIGEDLVNEAEYGSFRVYDRAEAPARRRFSRPLLIAALIGLMVFLMGCAWIILRMQDMKLGDETLYYDVFDDEGFVGREPVEMEVLTFAGVKGSPSYQAAKEWFDFLRTYDPESKIYHSVYKNLPDFPEEYSSYNLYTQEMKDALESILQKYNLKPVGSLLAFNSVENVCAALEIEKFTMDANGVQTNITGGYPFENGNFMLIVDIKLPDDTASQVCRTQGQIDWYRKDCLSQDHIYLEDIGQWKEWNYTTAAGNDVLIIRSDSDWRAWIICEREEAMLVLRLESRIDLGYNEDCSKHWGYLEMTDKQLEMVADTIDFGIQPRVATQKDVENQPEAPDAETQDGYTIQVKSVETDGWIARITLSITAPEGTIISRNTAPGFEEERFHIGPTNLDNFKPAADRYASASGGWNVQEDGDGLDNTQDLVMEARYSMEDGSAPFASGKTWIIHFEDLVGNYWDSTKSEFAATPLATGEWTFEITFDETNGDYNEIELLTVPAEIGVSVGWKPDGTDVVENVTVNSIKLRKYSLTITHDGPEHVDFSFINGQRMFAVMKDGSEIEILGTGGVYQAHGEIDFEQLDYIQLADGTKLTIPAENPIG